jgi:S-layer family protein
LRTRRLIPISRLLLGFAAVSLGTSTAIAQVPAGPEFHISDSGVAPNNHSPNLAYDAAGNFVVTWSEWGFPPTPEVVARRYDAAGVPRGPRFVVNGVSTPTQYRAVSSRVASMPAGDFVIVWTTGDDADGSQKGVAARRYDAAGAPVGAPFQVNTYTSLYQQYADLALDGNGNFVVVWQDESGEDGSGKGIFGQRYDALGNRRGVEFRVNSYTTLDQQRARVASDPAGNFVVTWHSDGQDGSTYGIFAQRYDSLGMPAGPEFQVNTYTTGYQKYPSIAALGSGFVVVWGGDSALPPGFGVVGQRFNSAGARIGSEFAVNTYPATQYPSVASNAAGEFVVAWQTYGRDGSGFGIFAQRFDGSGLRRGGEFQVNTWTTAYQYRPAAAMDSSGNFVVAWVSRLQASTLGVFGQRFGPLAPVPPVPDPGGNGVLEPGEAVGLVTSWHNASGAAQTVTGAASLFTGPGAPGNPGYTILDAVADYGTVQNGATANCSIATGNCFAFAIGTPSSRPTLHWDATFREEILPAPQGPPLIHVLHIGDSFTDVPRTSGFYRFVETILHHDLTGGCGGGNFCPAQATPREQMSVFVLVAKEGAGYQPPACVAGAELFADVPASSPYCRWIEELAHRNIAGGCGGGNFCPLALVSREQMSVFALATKEPAGYNPPGCIAGSELFADVPASSPFCKWVEELAHRNIAGGCGGGNFCPLANVTREQNAVFVSGTFALALY